MSKHRSLGVLFMFAASAAPLYGQSSAIALALAHVTSPVDSIREESITELRRAAAAAHVDVCAPSTAPEIGQTLIDALTRENGRMFPATSAIPKEGRESDFYPALIDCVASLHDRRAASALLGALDTGMMARSGFIALGADVAVPELLAIVNDGNERQGRRTSAIQALGEITAPDSHLLVSTADRERIHSALIGSLNAPDSYVRKAAAVALRGSDAGGGRKRPLF